MTESDFVDFVLKKKIKKVQSVKAVADWIGCTDVYLHGVIRGKDRPGDKILDAFGYERAPVSIRRKKR